MTAPRRRRRVRSTDPVLNLFDELTDTEDWRDLALCAETDPEAFFPEKGESTAPAKRICNRCDVREECLEFALAHDQRFGVWGGMSERGRRRLRDERAAAARAAPAA